MLVIPAGVNRLEIQYWSSIAELKLQVRVIQREIMKSGKDILLRGEYVGYTNNKPSGFGFGASTGLFRGSLLTISKLSFRSLFVPF